MEQEVKLSIPIERFKQITFIGSIGKDGKEKTIKIYKNIHGH